YYLPTTAYYPTTYYYPTTFYPMTFYSPTVLDTAVVSASYTTARSSACCGGETIVAAAPAVRMYPSEQTPVATTPAPRTNTRSRTSPIQSEPAEDDSINSNVPELPPREPAPRSDASGAAAGRSDSPPNPPVPARVQPKPASPNTSPTSPAPSGGVERPKAPAGPEDLEPAPAGDQTTGSGSGGRRVVQKPVLPASREVRSQFRNVLFGRVKTRDTNEPEEGVRVTISNRTNAYADRVALTDAFGRFAVKVPDGDWTVNVTMPSGRAYSVSQITVSNGLISDDIGRDIPSLVITR
ncbi:MAG: carboxypeptidase regulatory-like domain-containing protein, partial [Isosphaeraceae bacterium]